MTESRFRKYDSRYICNAIQEENDMEYKVRTKGVCSSEIKFDLDGDKVTNVSFTGGCNGNLKAISKLVDGMTVDQIESYLLGNTCGFRNTSCADQLAKGVRACYNESKN